MNYSLETTFTWRFASCHSGGCLFACLFVSTVGKQKRTPPLKRQAKFISFLTLSNTEHSFENYLTCMWYYHQNCQYVVHNTSELQRNAFGIGRFNILQGIGLLLERRRGIAPSIVSVLQLVSESKGKKKE